MTGGMNMLVLETAIDSVSIYRSGAEVVRRGSIELEEGTQKLYITGITGSTRYDTIRIFSTEGIKCTNQRYETLGNDQEEKESERIQEQIDAIATQIGIREMQIEMWKSNGDFTGRSSQSPEEVAEYIEKLPERIDSLNAAIAGLRKKSSELEKEKEDALERENRTAAVVDIAVEKAGKYPFEIRYFDSNARWNPEYEIYTDGEGPLDVRMKARIRQNTGEDWNGTSVTLYSGNPASGRTLPDLGTVYLDFQVENPMLRMAAAGAMRNSMMGMQMMSAAKATADTAYYEAAVEEVAEEEMMPQVRMTTDEATVNSDEAMTEYVLSGRKDIPEGGDGTSADLQNYVIPAKYELAAAPAADPRTFLTAKVKPADIPFRNAITAGVFLRNMYMSSVSIDPDLTDEEIVITLGEEERIKVSRKEVSRKAANTFLKGLRTVEYGFETKVTNLSGSPMEVVVKDQVPVSREKDITVDVLELSGMKLDKETGIVTGTVSVPGGQTVTSALSYKVSWPKDKKLAESRTHTSGRTCPSCGATGVTGKFCYVCGSRMY